MKKKKKERKEKKQLATIREQIQQTVATGEEMRRKKSHMKWDLVCHVHPFYHQLGYDVHENIVMENCSLGKHAMSD